MLGLPNFRVRSRDRDAETDSARIQRVVRAVSVERDAAVYEREGLRRRLSEATVRAAMTMDSIGYYGERTPDEERQLSRTEDTMSQVM